MLIELWAVMTRPKEANGLALTPEEALRRLRRVRRAFPLLEETPATLVHWQRLVARYEIVGRQVYDTRLIALMQAHRVTRILTFNGAHFRRFESITVLAPEDIA